MRTPLIFSYLKEMKQYVKCKGFLLSFSLLNKVYFLLSLIIETDVIIHKKIKNTVFNF